MLQFGHGATAVHAQSGAKQQKNQGEVTILGFDRGFSYSFLFLSPPSAVTPGVGREYMHNVFKIQQRLYQVHALCRLEKAAD